MTLTEFLTARLDEEEAVAESTGLHAQANGFDTGMPPMGSGGIRESPEYPTVYVNPKRVLADIAAKRAIVEEYVEADAYYRVRADAPAGELTGLRTAVLLLAQPYADHPDFDPAWRMK